MTTFNINATSNLLKYLQVLETFIAQLEFQDAILSAIWQQIPFDQTVSNRFVMA